MPVGLTLVALAVVAVVLGDGGLQGEPIDSAARSHFCEVLDGDFAHRLDLAGGEHWGDGSSLDLRRTMATFAYSRAFVHGAPPELRGLATRVRDHALTLDPIHRDRPRALEEFATLRRRAHASQACPGG